MRISIFILFVLSFYACQNSHSQAKYSLQDQYLHCLDSAFESRNIEFGKEIEAFKAFLINKKLLNDKQAFKKLVKRMLENPESLGIISEYKDFDKITPSVCSECLNKFKDKTGLFLKDEENTQKYILENYKTLKIREILLYLLNHVEENFWEMPSNQVNILILVYNFQYLKGLLDSTLGDYQNTIRIKLNKFDEVYLNGELIEPDNLKDSLMSIKNNLQLEEDKIVIELAVASSAKMKTLEKIKSGLLQFKKGLLIPKIKINYISIQE